VDRKEIAQVLREKGNKTTTEERVDGKLPRKDVPLTTKGLYLRSRLTSQDVEPPC